jgi:hypothetical protein
MKIAIFAFLMVVVLTLVEGQWFYKIRWFSPNPPVSSTIGGTNKMYPQRYS